VDPDPDSDPDPQHWWEILDESWQPGQQGGGGGHPVGGQGQAARVPGRGPGQWRSAHTLVPAHFPGGKGMYHEIRMMENAKMYCL
jgi:hypothetical protein